MLRFQVTRKTKSEADDIPHLLHSGEFFYYIFIICNICVYLVQLVKFMFYKKATKNCEIFTINLMFT